MLSIKNIYNFSGWEFLALCLLPFKRKNTGKIAACRIYTNQIFINGEITLDHYNLDVFPELYFPFFVYLGANLVLNPAIAWLLGQNWLPLPPFRAERVTGPQSPSGFVPKAELDSWFSWFLAQCLNLTINVISPWPGAHSYRPNTILGLGFGIHSIVLWT